ncbi:MAG TPA: hypothetical protein VMW35_08075 [Myxococcota bacterium]|jgi:hypothetical protein|nr:hypothetical protein [Myxococcota bacterium]
MSDPAAAARALLERTERVREALARGLEPEALERALAERARAVTQLADAVAATGHGRSREAAAILAEVAAASEALLADARRELGVVGRGLDEIAELRRALQGFQRPDTDARFVSFRA